MSSQTSRVSSLLFSSFLAVLPYQAFAQLSLPAFPPSLSLVLPSTIPVPTQTSFPSPQCSSGPSQDQSLTTNYNFESVERGIPGLPLTNIGQYNLLNFADILWINTDIDKDGNHLGIAPYTYPDVAALNPVGQPTISVDYIESTIDSFDAHSMWMGCVFPFPITAGSLPENCTLTAKGIRSGATVATQQFQFFANGSIVQDQVPCKFNSGFANLHALEFSVTSPITTAPLIDNFIATVHQRSCSAFYTGSYNNGK